MFRFWFGAKDGFCENFGVMWCTGWMNENIAFEPSVLLLGPCPRKIKKVHAHVFGSLRSTGGWHVLATCRL
jgi:hypothetical protein